MIAGVQGNEREKGRTLLLFKLCLLHVASGNEAGQIRWDELDGDALSFPARSPRAGITQAPPCISQGVIGPELEALVSVS